MNTSVLCVRGRLSADLPGADGGLVARLQRIDDGLVELTELGTGNPNEASAAKSIAPTDNGKPATDATNTERPLLHVRWYSEKDARWWRSLAPYLISSIAAFEASPEPRTARPHIWDRLDRRSPREQSAGWCARPRSGRRA